MYFAGSRSPLYLWHWPLLSFARIIEGETPCRTTRIIAVLIAIALAWFTYRFFERYVRHARKFSRTVTIILVLLMSAIGALGYSAYKFDGLNFRFPSQVRNLSSKIELEWADHIQFEACHLQTPSKVQHEEKCYQTSKPLIVLWGDSTASSLYPGLKNLQQRKQFGLTQLTQAGCPPIFGLIKLVHSTNCNTINMNVLSDLIRLQPDILIMHAAWQLHDYPMNDDLFKLKIQETIVRLKTEIPNTRIIIIGPVPRWDHSPQKVAFNFWKHSTDKTSSIPTHLDAIILNNIENILTDIVLEYNLEYISPTEYLCIKNQCIWKTGQGEKDFISIDSIHLSKAGSIYLVDKISSKIIVEK